MLSKIDRFEDLIAWQKARELTRAIYQVTGHGTFASDYGLARQIQRAAVSIMANIAEGFERGGRGNFTSFFRLPKLHVQRYAHTSMLLSMLAISIKQRSVIC